MSDISHFSKKNIEDNQNPSVCYMLDIPKVLDQCANAIAEAAEETHKELINNSRNRLSAYNRIAYHSEFFLRLTNPVFSTLQNNNIPISHEINKLRHNVAIRVNKIAAILKCPHGIQGRSLRTHECNNHELNTSITSSNLYEEASIEMSKLSKIFKQASLNIVLEIPRK